MKKEKVKPNDTQLISRVIKVDELLTSFMGYMPNPDEVLRDAGEAIGIYRDMKTDARVKSLLPVVKGAILSFPTRLERGEASERVMGFCEESLRRTPFYEIEKRLLTAIDYGFSAVEIVWENDDGWRYPADAVQRKPERFAFDAEGRLKHKTASGELVDLYSMPYKWLVYQFEKDAENPYGTSALKACYWPWKFKKAGAEFWLMAAEKFSVPSILALFETNAREAEIRDRAAELSELVCGIRAGSGAALANIKDVKLLDAPEKLSEFKTLMEWCDTQIAYGIVYQSLAVQEAEYGTRSQAEVHQTTLYSAAKNVCRELTPILQDFIDWIVELNFGPDEPAPRAGFDLKENASWEQVRDAIDRSVPVSKSTLYDRYGLPEPSDATDSFIKPEPAVQSFALSDPPDKKKARPVLTLR